MPKLFMAVGILGLVLSAIIAFGFAPQVSQGSTYVLLIFAAALSWLIGACMFVKGACDLL